MKKRKNYFRNAIARDPASETLEGQTAQLFLARTLHSKYIGNRQNTALAEEAITGIQKGFSERYN